MLLSNLMIKTSSSLSIYNTVIIAVDLRTITNLLEIY